MLDQEDMIVQAYEEAKKRSIAIMKEKEEEEIGEDEEMEFLKSIHDTENSLITSIYKKAIKI
jgi:hypothetical protein